MQNVDSFRSSMISGEEGKLIQRHQDGQRDVERRQSGLGRPRGERFRAALHLPGALGREGSILEPDALLPGMYRIIFQLSKENLSLYLFW